MKTSALSPTRHIEQRILTAILDGTYPPGTVLPAERELAVGLGVTRPTLRETLHRLAGEGWLTIRHGKATKVNDFWETGGLRILGTLARFGQFMPGDFIDQLLEFRCVFFPAIARAAASHDPESLRNFLCTAEQIRDEAWAYAAFDWSLQTLSARLSKNRVYVLIYNDFKGIYEMMADLYFAEQEGRAESAVYYRDFRDALDRNPETVENVVKRAMNQSISLWRTLADRTSPTTIS